MGKLVKYVCDIDNCSTEVLETDLREHDVVFITDQDEGRATKPYLSAEEVYLCSEHKKQLINLLPLRASGAQGHNKYFLATPNLNNKEEPQE